MRDTVRKIAVTLAAVAVYRMGCAIAVPTVRPEALEFISTTRYGAIWSQFGGNPSSSVSIMALGVVPYVTATLILQLLAGILPSLARLQEDAQGRARQRRITVITALAIAVMQATVTLTVFKQTRAMIGVTIEDGALSAVITVVSLFAGFVLLLLLADVVTRFGIGSGISVLLLVTVLSGTGSLLKRALPLANTSEIMVAALVTTVMLTLAVVGLRSYRGIRLYSTEFGAEKDPSSTELRAHVLQGGIAPIVFAGSMLGLLGVLVTRTLGPAAGALVGGGGLAGALLFAAVMAAFTKLHVRMTLDPVKTANDFVKSGYFIEGTPPGRATADRLARIGSSCAIALAALLLPLMLLPVMSSLPSGGLSDLIGASTLLLAAGVAVDVLRNYQGETRNPVRAPRIVSGGVADPWVNG